MTVYKLNFFVPKTHKEVVKQAVFDAGAGRYIGYDQCSWEVLGRGQFRPLDGSRPFIGQPNTLEYVEEYRVEMLCDERFIKAAINALLLTHPYDVPAYECWPINTLKDFTET